MARGLREAARMFEDDVTRELSFEDEPTREMPSKDDGRAHTREWRDDVTLQLPPISRPLSFPGLVIDVPSPRAARSTRASRLSTELLTRLRRLRGALREPLAAGFAAMFVVACGLAGGFGLMLGHLTPARRVSVSVSAVEDAAAGEGARAGAGGALRAPRVVVLTSAREEITLAPPTASAKVERRPPAPAPPESSAAPAVLHAHVPTRPRGFGHLGSSR